VAQYGSAQGVEHRQVCLAQADISEGDGPQFIRGRKRDTIAQAARQFLERDLQLPVKRRAAILLEGALRDQQRQQLALRHMDGGKRVHRMRIAIGLDLRVGIRSAGPAGRA